MYNVLPTQTRRFKHLISAVIVLQDQKWTVHFEHKHTEVYPTADFRVYENVSVKHVSRILSLSGVTVKPTALKDVTYFFVHKPFPLCQYEGCTRKASVPTWKENTGNYYCADHREIDVHL